MDLLVSDGRSTARRKKNSACNRCRTQKVRCGNQEPSCSNCVRAGVECVRPAADIEASRQYIRQLEQRTQWLEDVVRKISPETLSRALPDTSSRDLVARRGQQSGRKRSRSLTPALSRHSQYSNVNAALLSPTVDSPETQSQIGPNHPLAHDVGLLSLANSAEPKYLGPSSGVSFAHLIFASAPQSQGLPSGTKVPEVRNDAVDTFKIPNELAELPPEDEMRYFMDAYFETWQPLYPFIQEDLFQEMVTKVLSQVEEPSAESPSQSMDLAQLFLVNALGAKVLESRLSTNFESESYYATAMSHIAKVQLHDSIRGVQTMLLLVLSSLLFPSGMNAWFLMSTIMASCLDLGLQRKHRDDRLGGHTPIENAHLSKLKLLRSGVFWSAYSLDRALCVILGRPLTLRDEGIDIEYPGEWESEEVDCGATYLGQGSEPSAKRIRLSHSPYSSAIYSFRFDRILAETKLMLYRVAQSSARFPWPTDLPQWQAQAEYACREILQNAQEDLKWRGFSSVRGTGLQNRSIRVVELKFHKCLMLLYRPSPAISQPTSSSLMICYDSAVATIRIQSELARFANMANSWLTAHAIFVSGITILYCLWTCPEVRKATSLKTFLLQADTCTNLLSTLGKVWSVAKNAQRKFDHLVQLTKHSWNLNQSLMAPESQNQQTTNTYEPFLQPNNIPEVLDTLPAGFWDGLDVNFAVPPNMLMDELGDMGSWFDLDWLGDTNFTS